MIYYTIKLLAKATDKNLKACTFKYSMDYNLTFMLTYYINKM